MISQRSYKKLVSMLVGHESEEPPKQKRSVCCAALRTVVDVKVLMLTMTIWTAIIAVVMLFGMLSGPPDPYSELSLLKKTTEADEAFVKNVNKLLLEWAENRYIYGNQLLSKDMRKIVERGSQMTEERIKLAYKYVREAVSNNRTERAIMDTVELYVRVLGHERTVEVARFLATFIGSDGRDGAGLLVQIETLYAAEMGELIRETLPSTKLGERAELLWTEYILHHTPGLTTNCLLANSTREALLHYFRDNFIYKTPKCLPRSPWYQNDVFNRVFTVVSVVLSFGTLYAVVFLVMKQCVIEKHSTLLLTLCFGW